MLPTIVEEPDVTSNLQVASARFPRLEEAWSAVTWVLVRTPGIGMILSSQPPPWYMYRLDAVAIGAPTFVIVYSYDQNFVTIHNVRIS